MLKQYHFRPYRLAIPLLSLLLPVMAIGQEWQWAKFGGSNDAIPGGFYSMPEKVVSMATDPEGNIFSLAPVGISSVEIDGIPKESYGSYDGGGGATLDYMISSFSCDGVLRWAKVIGGPSDDYLKNIRTDAAGNVYTSGYLINTSIVGEGYQGIHFDEDQVVEFQGWDTNSQVLYLIKYSNDGELEWVRTPQPGTVTFASSASQNRNLGVEVDPQGNSYWLCQLGQGAYCNGAYVNNTAGTLHIFKYDTDGNFIEAHPFEAEITGYNAMTFKMVRNHKTGVIYLAGYRFTSDESEYVKVDGQLVTHTSYLAAFNSNGESLWLKQNTATTMFGHGFDDISLDNEGNIYLAGAAMNNDGFGSVSFTPSFPYVYPVAYKLDAEGNVLWGTAASTVQMANFAAAIVSHGDEVWVTGGGMGITWGGFNVPLVFNQGDDIYIYKFNAANGQATGVEQIASNVNSFDSGTALTAANGAFYLGAAFAYHVTLGEHELFTGTQQTDFLIAKYGTDECYCANPEPSFSFTTTVNESGTYAFEYTGDIDYQTINWYFGGGGTSTEVNPEHTFTQAGNYEVCVAVSNLCGITESCQVLNVAATPAFGLQNVKVYPNPADNVLNISSDEDTSFEIFSLLGAKVLGGELAAGSQQVDLHSIASGVYMLKLQSNTGAQQTIKLIVK